MPASKIFRPRIFGVTALLVLLAHLAVSFDYSNWYWGFNHYFFLPPLCTLIAIGLGCVLCLPWVSECILNAYRRFKERIGPAHLDSRVLHLIVAGIACICFWLLKTRTHLLGDGRLLIQLLDEGKWFHPLEPLDRLVHYVVYRLSHGSLGWHGTAVYTAVSVGAGFVYALAALRLGAIVKQRLFVAAFLLTIGTVQLFLGYAESYSLATALILVYMVLCLEHCRGERRLVWPAVALAAGIAFHHSLVFLIPSFVYLCWSGDMGSGIGTKRRMLLCGAYLAVIVSPLIVTSRYWDTGEMSLIYVPVLEHRVAQYTMFSWEHLVDFMNEQILISPLAWLVAIAFGVAFWRDPSLRQSRLFRFLAFSSVFPAIFSFVLRPGLGGSRDWDLWSMGSLPYVAAVAYWIGSWLGRQRQVAYAAFVIVVVGFFHVVPWVVVNRSPALSVEHFKRMLVDNPLWTDQRIGAGNMLMASFYVERGALEEATEYLERAVGLVPRQARYWRELGGAYLILGRLEAAEGPFRRAARLDRTDPRAYMGLGEVYLRQGRFGEAESALKQAAEIDPSRARTYFFLGWAYHAQRLTGEAVAAYRRAVELSPLVEAYWHHLAVALEELPGRENEAIEAWKHVVILTEKDPALRGLMQEAQNHIKALQQD